MSTGITVVRGIERLYCIDALYQEEGFVIQDSLRCHAEAPRQDPHVAFPARPGLAQPPAGHEQARREVVTGAFGYAPVTTRVDDGDERVVENVLEFVGEAPPLAALGLSAVQDDQPPSVRPLGGGHDALDLDVGQSGDDILPYGRPADLAPPQEPVGLAPQVRTCVDEFKRTKESCQTTELFPYRSKASDSFALAPSATQRLCN